MSKQQKQRQDMTRYTTNQKAQQRQDMARSTPNHKAQQRQDMARYTTNQEAQQRHDTIYKQSGGTSKTRLTRFTTNHEA